MKHSGKNPTAYYAIGALALFLAGFLLLVVFGAKSYQNVVVGQNDNMDRRALGAYIATSVKANDASGAVSIEEFPYGQVLVVTDVETGYALRFYRYEGQLVEDFARSGAELAPDKAQPVGATERFELKEEDGLLTVVTDAGRTLLNLRSGEGAKP